MYGERFESADDGDFDRMFRGLIGRAYTCMDSPVPAEVYRPLANSKSSNTHTVPKQALNPDFSLQPSRKIDWYDAGVVYPKTGSMASGNEQFECLRFGFDSRHFFFRFESKSDLSADPVTHIELTIDGRKEPLKAERSPKLETNSNRLEAHLVQCSDTVVEGYLQLDKEHWQRGGLDVQKR